MPYWFHAATSVTSLKTRASKETKDRRHPRQPGRRGWFGPVGLQSPGQADLWPHTAQLATWHEATGDARVVPFMTRYFRWQTTVPDADFLVGYWPKIRGGDNLESIYWLYNRTGESWLLPLAEKVHRCTSNWTDGVANWHGVNITQGFREPATYW